MAVGSKEAYAGARGIVGTLLVAWTFVAGAALVMATTYYQRTGDLRVIIVWVGAPFLVGTMLFACLGVVALAGREKPRRLEEVHHTGTKGLHARR